MAPAIVPHLLRLVALLLLLAPLTPAIPQSSPTTSTTTALPTSPDPRTAIGLIYTSWPECAKSCYNRFFSDVGLLCVLPLAQLQSAVACGDAACSAAEMAGVRASFTDVAAQCDALFPPVATASAVPVAPGAAAEAAAKTLGVVYTNWPACARTCVSRRANDVSALCGMSNETMQETVSCIERSCPATDVDAVKTTFRPIAEACAVAFPTASAAATSRSTTSASASVVTSAGASASGTSLPTTTAAGGAAATTGGEGGKASGGAVVGRKGTVGAGWAAVVVAVGVVLVSVVMW
ncbi:hypothetical protein HDU96_008492 [Phlyctochytrium bullatum]|nr:hypothetical protein HDU96_008492 [Phlyctochytrium bullatum]